jgi:hypothetical protein
MKLDQALLQTQAVVQRYVTASCVEPPATVRSLTYLKFDLTKRKRKKESIKHCDRKN